MSLIQLDFVYAEDQEYGGDGWIPKIMPKFNASQGLGVAHDAMEHFNVAAGTLEEEILAFGAMLYMRVETGWFCQQGSYQRAGNILGGDLARFLSDHWHQGGMLRMVKGRPRHLEDDMEEELDSVIEETRRQLRGELGDDDWHQFQRDTIDVWNRLRRWMRQGYWQCKRRYRGASNHDLAYAFTQIRDAVDKIKFPELGEELHVRLSINHNGRVQPTVRRLELADHYPEDDYN
jgi:hypothetical protein